VVVVRVAVARVEALAVGGVEAAKVEGLAAAWAEVDWEAAGAAEEMAEVGLAVADCSLIIRHSN
jgi:hypothetical protein